MNRMRYMSDNRANELIQSVNQTIEGTVQISHQNETLVRNSDERLADIAYQLAQDVNNRVVGLESRISLHKQKGETSIDQKSRDRIDAASQAISVYDRALRMLSSYEPAHIKTQYMDNLTQLGAALDKLRTSITKLENFSG